MTLQFAGALDRGAIVHAADLVLDLIRRPEVAEAWKQESSCAGMSVGGLTQHLASQPGLVTNVLGADRQVRDDAETIDVLGHYARAAWVREDVDGDTNRAIRDAADRQATDGPEAVAAMVSDGRVRLQDALASAPPTAYLPWQGWALPTDDFLVTRLMEMVVHADDLAASVNVATPSFGTEILDPVFRLLAALSVRRHGQDALVRTLTRPQRAPATVAAF